MPRPSIGPANIAPPLRCERLEDRSLLSSTTLYATLGDLVFAEPMPCEELPAGGMVLEEGGTAILYEGEVTTLEGIDGRDGVIADGEYWEGPESFDEYADEWYYEDELYYEEEYWDESWYYEDELYYDELYYDDSWYYEDEMYFEDDWYYEDELYFDDSWYYEEELYFQEEYWDDTWYSDEAYSDESWHGEYEFVDGGGMTWEEYEDVWLAWDRSEVISAPTPGDDLRDLSWTLGKSTDLDDGMVLTMALAEGIAIPDAPAAPSTPDVAETLPLPLPATESEAKVSISLALPPSASSDDAVTPPDIVVSQVDEDGEPVATTPVERTEPHVAATPALASPSTSDDHLVDEDSLELSEDLRVG